MEERIINIGTRLKQRRKEMHIKQTEMAKELGVSQTYLSNIEGGKANCSITLLVDYVIILMLHRITLCWGI